MACVWRGVAITSGFELIKHPEDFADVGDIDPETHVVALVHVRLRDLRQRSGQQLGDGEISDSVAVVAEDLGENVEGVLAKGRAAIGHLRRGARQHEA